MDIIISLISKQLNISERQIRNTLKLLADGATVPFIARYRKEATGALDETQIQDIKTSLERYHELANRKETIISTDDSPNKILLIPTNEELVIALDTAKLVREAQAKEAE